MPRGQAKAGIPHQRHTDAVMGRQSLLAFPGPSSEEPWGGAALSCAPSTGRLLDVVLAGWDALQVGGFRNVTAPGCDA